MEAYCPRQEARITLTSPSGDKMVVRGRCTNPAKATWSVRVTRVDALTPLPDWPIATMHRRGGGASPGLTITVPDGTPAEGTAIPPTFSIAA